MTRQPHEKFANWATQYQGFDGGNPTAELWFCGIEFGGKDSEATVKLADDVEGDWIKWETIQNEKIPYISAIDKTGKLDEDMKVDGPFAIAQSKIVSNYLGRSVDTWKKLAGKSGNCFKMNLYPLPFRSHDDTLWTKEHHDRTGLICKSEYKTWNLNNRFPRLKHLVNTFSPKVLICFGVSLENEYLCAFCDNDEQIFEHIDSKTIGNEQDKSQRTLRYRMINSGKTLLLIAPFPTGAYGLNSNALLEQVAESAKDLYRSTIIQQK